MATIQRKQSAAFAIAVLSSVCIDSVLMQVEAKPAPGLYVVGRDLAGSAVIGTHQFIVMVPEDSSKFDTRDLGDGTQGIVVGAHNQTRLLVDFFETSDYQAIKEYTNPDKYVSFFKPDLDAEVHPVNIGSNSIDSAIQITLNSIAHYTAYEAIHNHPYPSTSETLENGPTLLNSNSWAQSLIEHNFGTGKVVEDFIGKDSGHQNRFPSRYFK